MVVMTTGSSRLTVPCSLAELQTVSKLHQGWYTSSGLNQGPTSTVSLQIQDQYGTPPSKKRRKKKGEKDPASPHPDRPRDLDFIRHNYLICFISCCPKGWQADQWALCSLRKPAASQRPVDQVIKTLLPLLLVIKYFHAFVNRFSSFNPTGHKKHNFSSLDIPAQGCPKF